MLFNSFEYILFLLLIILLFTYLKNFRKQLIIAGSLFFYSFNDPINILLLFYVTFEIFYSAKLLANSNFERKRKVILIFSIIFCLAPLIYFKYYSFFSTAVNSIINTETSVNHISELLIPIGISFYTLQAIGYIVDVYKQKISNENSLINFALFISFFPQLIAGPIERANKLLPQLKKLNLKRIEIYPGINRITLGLFKKIVIADGVGFLINSSSLDTYDLGLSNIFLGAAYYVIIYCDFSGYVDIALGTASIFGIKLSENFDRPYLAASLKEFWHRWHMTLSFWFRDYIYIPLGGSQVSPLKFLLLIVFVFTLSGLWHGANWNFVLWGLIHALLYVSGRVFNSFSNKRVGCNENKIYKGLSILFTFILVSLSWIVFFTPDFMMVTHHFFSLGLALINIDIKSAIKLFIIIVNNFDYYHYLIPLISIVALALIENSRLVKMYLYDYNKKYVLKNSIINDVIWTAILFVLITGDTTRFIYFNF